MRNSKMKGFTLIELLAVVLILGVIALVAIPTVSTIVKEDNGTYVYNFTTVAYHDVDFTTLTPKNQEDNMNDCIFCKIIKGDLPSKTIYEDDLIKVIMNINPTTNGDLLILPKKHYVDIFDIDEKIINHSFIITRDILFPLLKENKMFWYLVIATIPAAVAGILQVPTTAL